ncbi:hypothetical protein ACEN4P_09840 [Marinilactibacillus psychrotolerans]|uniref:Lin0368 family putative glycerol transporter subunit n=1 Tax=Marinilactibacillus psychrotolerans TaxID=191770 RepID=UPI00388512C1
MTTGQAIATMVGGFLFPFMIRLSWGKLVDDFGPIGGWMAAAFIVGTVWTINHGINHPMITQSENGAWIDMAVAGAVGVYVASIVRGGKVKPSMRNISAGLSGGVLAGLVLSFFL